MAASPAPSNGAVDDTLEALLQQVDAQVESISEADAARCRSSLTPKKTRAVMAAFEEEMADTKTIRLPPTVKLERMGADEGSEANDVGGSARAG